MMQPLERCRQSLISRKVAKILPQVMLQHSLAASSQKKVAELWDIAHTLGLKDDGKKYNLLLLIKSHLNSHPDLHNKECFAGLYVTRSLK